MDGLYFRKANIHDFKCIWDIILFAKESMRQKGSQQWQDGYPFEETIKNDITQGYAYVVTLEQGIIAYVVISHKEEPYL